MKLNTKLFIAVSILAFTLFGCGGNIEPDKEEHHDESGEVVQLSVESINQIKLETEPVLVKAMTGYITVPATVIPNQDNEAQIGSLIQGRVHRVFVKVGDYVKAGQVLMSVEGMDVGEIQAGYLIAKAALDYTKANYERQKKLFDEKIGSQKSLLESQAEYEKAVAEYKAEDQRIHSVGLTDEDVTSGNGSGDHTPGMLSIKSPISGVVVERNVVIGQFVDATKNAFKVIDINKVWVDGQIYEKDINKIGKSVNAVFTPSAYPNEKFNGRVTYVSQIIDKETRTITIRAEFNNPNEKLKPQMYGEMRIPTGKNSMSILIPAESLVKIKNMDYVFVKKDNHSSPGGGQEFEKRAVITGLNENDIVEIKEGLNENESVVVKGAFYLKSELMKAE